MLGSIEKVVATVDGADVDTVVSRISVAVETSQIIAALERGERGQLGLQPFGGSSAGTPHKKYFQSFQFVDNKAGLPNAGGSNYEVLVHLDTRGQKVVIEAAPATIAELGLTGICKDLGYKLAGKVSETEG